MAPNTDNSLARFERHKVSYPQLIVSILLFVLLAGGFALTAARQDWLGAGLFVASIVAFGALSLVNVSLNRRLLAAGDRRYIKWDAALPELQRQNVSLEVYELSRLLGTGAESMSDLLSAYIVAEDLALRQIQQEEKLPLLRHVSIGQTSFDAILIEQDMITCIEVSFVVVPDVRQDKIESILRKISTAKKNLGEMKLRLRLKLMLVVVTQLTAEEEDELRGMLITRRFSDTPVDIDIRLLDFESLQKTYVTD